MITGGRLKTGSGCYSVLVTRAGNFNKARAQWILRVDYCLSRESGLLAIVEHNLISHSTCLK